MRKYIKKMMISIAMLLTAVSSTTLNINAASSQSVSGIGYTLHGSINDTTLSASVTGSLSNIAIAYVNGIVLRSNDTKLTSTVSGSPYVRVNYRSEYSDAVRWISGYIWCTISGVKEVTFSLTNR